MQLTNTRDFWAGLMFIVTGASFAVGATNYSFGTAPRPGPGYFPFGLGILLAVLGLTILVKTYVARASAQDKVGHIAWRPLLIIALAIIMFAVTLPLLGLMIALPLLVAVSSAAGDEFRWRDVLLNSAILTLGSWAMFIEGLGLTIPVWPAFVG